MASEVCKLLVTVANSFISQGNPLQAIKCLQAICLSKKPEYPQVEAEVCLKLAELLLTYTCNVKEATKVLDKANLLLGKTSGHFCLKCDILAKLAECQKHSGLTRLRTQTCEKAIALCQQGLSSPEGEELKQWMLHFRCVLADAHAASQLPEELLRGIEDAVSGAQETQQPAATVILQLGILQHQVQAGDPAAVGKAMQAAADAILALENFHSSSGAPLPELRLHFEVLRAIWLLLRGETLELMKNESGKSEGTPMAVDKLVQLASEAPESSSDTYSWLPVESLPVLAHIVAAAIWRPTGKLSNAEKHLKKAQELLQGALEQNGLNLADGERAVPPQRRAIAQQLTWLQFLILESSATILLTRTQLREGGAQVTALMKLSSSFPGMLKRQAAALHLLAGHYSHAVGAIDDAGRQFQAAISCSKDLSTSRLAAVNAALVMLRDESGSRVTDAMDLLKQHGMFSAAADLPAQDRAAGLFATAVVTLAQGKVSEGKALAAKALKRAHFPLHNHQLVSQIMCAMAPHFLENDLSAVGQMANSAFSLSKGLRDLPTQITAAALVGKFLESTGDMEKLAQQQQYLTQKEAALQKAIGEARESAEQHSQILEWGLSCGKEQQADGCRPHKRRAEPS